MDRKDSFKFAFDWGKYLTDQKSDAAPVQFFGHAQMSSSWSEIENGVKVEVLNSDCPVASKVYWIAQIIKVAGYKALLRYEGFGDDSSGDFWCNLCTHDVHAVGWCATVGKPLVPPKTIQFKYTNWKSFLIERLTGAKTLPNDFNERVAQSLECAFMPKMRVEVMDKCQISRKRVGVVEEIVGGRLRLQYEDSDEVNDDFWCHCSSSLIHPIGWSEKVGHRILVASKDYKNVPGFKNSKPDMFVPVKSVKLCGFKVGMKLEAIDPLNLSSICVATVRKVLKNGFLMIGIDGSEAAGGTDWFCYHCTSPSIFPVGYCYSHNITLSIPTDHKDTFTWPEYLQETKSEAAPTQAFMSENIDHGFVRGMKLEAVDLMDPRLLCVATVSRVVGRLLRIHFDGWDSEYDQWIDSQSPDIFPVGWCEMVRYGLQPPPNYKHLVTSNEGGKRKTKARTAGLSGKRKRKRMSAPEKRDSLNQEEDSEEKTMGSLENGSNKTSSEDAMEEDASNCVKNETNLGPPEEADLSLGDFNEAKPSQSPSNDTLCPDQPPDPKKTVSIDSNPYQEDKDQDLHINSVSSNQTDTTFDSEKTDPIPENVVESAGSELAVETSAEPPVLDVSMESNNLEISMEEQNNKVHSSDLGAPLDAEDLSVSEEINLALPEDSDDLLSEAKNSSLDKASETVEVENNSSKKHLDREQIHQTETNDAKPIDDEKMIFQTEECSAVGDNVEM